MNQIVGTDSWMDGTRGRAVRSLREETESGEVIAEDLLAIARETRNYIQRLGLTLCVSESQLFQILADHVIARQRWGCYTLLRGPAKKAGKPSGWSEDDERVWMEWLEMGPLRPKRVLDVVFAEETADWETLLGDWRREFCTYLPYLVVRSREILRENDGRPIADDTGTNSWDVPMDDDFRGR